jgi:hypothetical protein
MEEAKDTNSRFVHVFLHGFFINVNRTWTKSVLHKHRGSAQLCGPAMLSASTGPQQKQQAHCRRGLGIIILFHF